ncbi:Aspyridones efflux protein [Lachnellula hyalina]|uniref:Aspyridones efflux protein n=1 Tax=Lachnellula hyalina TaxID=1316788 RepID=A0A8H8U2U6_9HELO|nr:Aspyridones efflux protein [Lachnellula hyalina]TVY29363.1 Aspyridones efflux protein [Lachnellula hyalina]
MSSTSTRTFSLEALPRDPNISKTSTPIPEGSLSSLNFEPTNLDAIVAASRLADAEVPDGGYGWVVIAACSALTFWFVGTTYSWGIIQAALVERNLSSPSTISFVGSLACASISILALVNARTIRKLGARMTALIGVGCLGLGEILSGFSTRNVGALFFTAGVVMGIGCSPRHHHIFPLVSTITPQYFNKKRGIVNGFVYAGGGLGGTVISFAVNGLINSLGPEWTFRILGLVTLATSFPAAWLIKERLPITTATFVEWSLFKNVQFTTLFFAGAIATFPLFVPPFFLPLYSASLGLSPSAGAGLVVGFNFSSAVGRLCCGFLCDFMGPVNTLLLSLFLSALSMLAIWPVSSSLGSLIVFVIINGAANGGFFSCMPTVVGSVFGSRRVGVAMGMIVTGWGGGYLMGAPIARYLLAAYGGPHSTLKAYHPAMIYAGSMALGAALLVLVLKLRISKSPFKKL